MTRTRLASIPGPALLFCPADRPDRYAKAAAAADSVIIDLEDAVAPAAKESARAVLRKSALDPDSTIVRINPRFSGEQEKDLHTLRGTAYRTIMVPKAETAQDLAYLEGFAVIALCESPVGITGAEALAKLEQVIALTWGAEDLVAALGGTSSRRADGRFRDFARYARSHVLIAAAASGKPAYDTVHLDIADDSSLREEATDAAASGFSGTMCIHPSQVDVIRSAFAPSPHSLSWARAVMAAGSEAAGVFTFEGQMIDEPVIAQAQRILDTAVHLSKPTEGS